MKLSTLLSAFPVLLANLSSAISVDCDHIRVDRKSFDFSKLSGPHSILVHDEDRPPSIYNTTWTLDICQPLKKIKGLPNEDQCPVGTYVCGTVRSWNRVDDPNHEHVEIENVIPIAGNFETSNGKSLDPKFTRLKSTDADKDGLQLELYGGVYGRKKQKAVIEFQCDKDRTGNEGNEAAKSEALRPRDDEKEENPNSLTFVSYGSVEGKESMDVLRLNWRTKYACEDAADEPAEKKSGWGFFTWFVLILFLSIAAYLIFGSWLNYNRYGARGWDLLPHGDTIRDIPYLFKDWSRKVVDTVQGGGSRGGYSAV